MAMVFVACFFSAFSPIAEVRMGPASYHWGDDLAWSVSSFDDGDWPTAEVEDLSFEEKNLWIRIPVTVSPGTFDVPLSLYLAGLFSAEVYWDGELLGRKGRPGPDPDHEVAGPLDAVFWLPPERLSEGDHLLALRISAHHQHMNYQHPIHYLSIARYASYRAYFLNYYLPSLTTLGVLLLAAVYFGSRYALDRQDRAPLWLAMMSCSVVLALALETARAFFLYPYPFQFYRLSGMLFCAAIFGIFLILYLAARLRIKNVRGYLVVGSFLSLLVLPISGGFDLKIIMVYLIFFVSGLLLALDAVRRRIQGAHFAITFTATMIILLLLSHTDFLDRYLFIGFSLLLASLFIFEVRVLIRLRWEKTYADLAVERLETELLKRHIQPHFLMNTLTSLAEWMEADPAIGGAMIESLAAEFRGLINLAGKRRVTMGEEIELCRAHLKLMGFRNDRDFELVVENVDLKRQVPPTLFHTLLENAFSHNRYSRPGAVFQLRQWIQNGHIHYQFLAPRGAGPRGEQRSGGTGTTYIKARLKEAYGDQWSYHEVIDDAVVETTITLYAEPSNLQEQEHL